MNPKKKKLLIGIGAAAVVVVGAYVGLCAWVGGSQTIMKDVHVGGVSVGGMTQQQAKSTLEQSMTQAKSVTASGRRGKPAGATSCFRAVPIWAA